MSHFKRNTQVVYSIFDPFSSNKTLYSLYISSTIYLLKVTSILQAWATYIIWLLYKYKQNPWHKILTINTRHLQIATIIQIWHRAKYYFTCISRWFMNIYKIWRKSIQTWWTNMWGLMDCWTRLILILHNSAVAEQKVIIFGLSWFMVD